MIENSQPGGGYLLKQGPLEIPFQIEYTDRCRLTINVHPDMRLEVLAPTGRPCDAVLDRVEARASWIAKQWRYFERYQPTQPEPQFVSGETHRYLGRQYRLKVTQAIEPNAKLVGRFLHVLQVDPFDREATKELVGRWHHEHANSTFARRFDVCWELCKSLELKSRPRVSIRKMRRRWGSCTKAGNISLNLALARTPVHCIDYVIVHELCHLKIHNHSPNFYRTLDRILPDWRLRKQRLESQSWS